MRQLIMWILITLEGFFEGAKKWDLDWHEYVWGDELERFSIEQARSAEMLLFGRTTYEGMAAHWSKATGVIAEIMNTIPKVVFSNTLKTAGWNNTRLVNGRAEDEVVRLKREGGQSMLVFGSAELSASLMRTGLFDEYRLCIVPVVLGAGTPLFKPGVERVKMDLVETRRLQTGGVMMFCRPSR